MVPGQGQFCLQADIWQDLESFFVAVLGRGEEMLLASSG